MFDIERMRKNIDILHDWLSTQCIIIYNEFTNKHEHIRHIRLADDDINRKLIDNSNNYVELMCTGYTDVYTFKDEVFLSLVIFKTLLEKLDAFNTDFFIIKSNENTFYNHAIYFDIKDCGNACLSGL